MQTLDYTVIPDRVVVDNLGESGDNSLDESGENPPMTEPDTASVPVLQHAPIEQMTPELDLQHQSDPIIEPDEPMLPKRNAANDNQSPPMTDVHPPRLPPRSNRGIPKPTYELDPTSKVKYPMSNYVTTNHLSESNKSFVCQLSFVRIPNSMQEALSNQNWQAAMEEELRSLKKNDTWKIVDLPIGKKSMGCRWIFTVKYFADGTIDRYKARLVEKGYSEKYGIDYTETFAPVAKINTSRVLLSLAANLDWPLH